MSISILETTFFAFYTLSNSHKNWRWESLSTLSKFRCPASDKLKPSLLLLGVLRNLLSFSCSVVLFPSVFVHPHTRVSSADWTLLVERVSGLFWALLSVSCVGSGVLFSPRAVRWIWMVAGSSVEQGLTSAPWSTKVLSSSFLFRWFICVLNAGLISNVVFSEPSSVCS